jgi:membrane protease YdiL (CAAX protease family)
VAISNVENNQTYPATAHAVPRLWRRRDVWQIAALFIFLYLAGSAMAGLASGSSQLMLTVNIVLASVVAGFGSILIINRRRQRHSWQQLGFTTFSRQWLAAGAGLITLFAVGRSLLLNWLATTFPALNVGLDFLEEMLLFSSTAEIIISSAAVVLLVPIWEEFFFRGFIHNALRNRLGMWTAIFISSLMFGAFHLIPLQILGAFLLGLPLAWAYEKSGSLWLVIYMHALNNLLAVLLSYLLT